MLRKLSLAILCLTALGLVSPLAAQEASPPPAGDEAAEVPEANYRLKKVGLQIYGGTFSGGTFFELPTPWERTEVAEGSDAVYKYDGTVFNLDPDIYSAPRKRIESGLQIGGQISFYLSKDFHLDLQLAVASSKATTDYLFDDPRTPAEDPVRTTAASRDGYDEDPDFKSLMGGGGLCYDASNMRMFGLTPYVGCAFGAVINRFSRLEDKTALYFQVSGGFYRDLGEKLRASALFSATTFSFEREELTYGKQVTYGTVALGLTYLVDMIPR